jgi:hypothetical protein
MGMPKRRLTLGRMMAAIAIVALGFAVSRVDAAPAVSLCVFAGCTWYLAGRRYAEALARRAAEADVLSPARKARIAARCALTAAIAIGLPDAAFLGGFYGYMAVIRRIIPGETSVLWSPGLEVAQILFGALIGIAAALYVAALMRSRSRRVARKRRIATAPADAPTPPSTLEHGPVADRRVSAW